MPSKNRQDTDGPPTGNRQDATGLEAVDVRTAAARLGVTPDAIRSRLQRGTLPGERSPGGVWRVFLEPEPTPEQHDEPTADRQDATGNRQATDGALLEELRGRLSDQAATIEHLRGELAVRAAEIERRDQETRELRILLQQAQETTRLAIAATVAEHNEAVDVDSAATDDESDRLEIGREEAGTKEVLETSATSSPRSVFGDLFARLRGKP